jgi:hypothetical protein
MAGTSPAMTSSVERVDFLLSRILKRRRALTQIKFHPLQTAYSSAVQPRNCVMPTETAIIVAVIVAIFAIYAAALAWADFYTSRRPQK